FVKYVFLSRNFGKENCLVAGYDAFDGDALCVMDADMQDPPELLPKLIAEWENGADDVVAYRTKRDGEGFFKKFTSNMFYKVIKKFTKIEIPANSGDFRLMDKKCVEAMKLLQETQRYNKGLCSLIGFKKVLVPFEREKRFAGTSKFNFKKLLNLAIHGLMTFTTAPLRFATNIGIFGCLFTLFFFLYIAFKKIFFGDPIIGFPALITFIGFIGSLQFIILGIIGEYIGVIFNEVKKRPNYIVEKTNK
ncbi:MAG: glycosyltransferase family 2 protein, partial [Oscillospiraceae bacterium]|nr:glycosyltransferase family 2 protein [Oscillospiraceae bacterium]